MKKLTLAILIPTLLSLALAGCQNDLVGGGGGKSPLEGTWASQNDPNFLQVTFSGDKFEWRRSNGKTNTGTFRDDYGVIYWTITQSNGEECYFVYDQGYNIDGNVLTLVRNGDWFSGKFVKIK